MQKRTQNCEEETEKRGEENTELCRGKQRTVENEAHRDSPEAQPVADRPTVQIFEKKAGIYFLFHFDHISNFAK